MGLLWLLKYLGINDMFGVIRQMQRQIIVRVRESGSKFVNHGKISWPLSSLLLMMLLAHSTQIFTTFRFLISEQETWTVLGICIHTDWRILRMSFYSQSLWHSGTATHLWKSLLCKGDLKARGELVILSRKWRFLELHT